MDLSDRVIGALQEYKEASEKRQDRFEKSVEERFNRVDSQLESLKSFKWKAVGALIVVCFVIKVAVDLAAAH